MQYALWIRGSLMKRLLIILAISLFSVAILTLFCPAASTRLPKNVRDIMKSTPAPTPTPIPMRTLDGQEVFSQFDLVIEKTRIVISVVWDVSCPYCKQELLHLQYVYADRPEVLLVGINPYNTRKQIQEYINENEIFSIIVITGAMDRLPPGVPFTSIYLRDGTLLNEFFGWSKEYSPDQLAEIIEGELH